MANLERIAEAEKKFKRKHKIELRNYDHNDTLSLKEFIETFIKTLNSKTITIYKTNKKQQCHGNASRSIGDIYNLCRNYYPNCTLQEVMKIMFILQRSGFVMVSFCGTIMKQVFSNWGEVYATGEFTGVDEQGLTRDDYLTLK